MPSLRAISSFLIPSATSLVTPHSRLVNRSMPPGFTACTGLRRVTSSNKNWSWPLLIQNWPLCTAHMHFGRKLKGFCRQKTPLAPPRKASITRSRSSESSNITIGVFDLARRSWKRTLKPAKGPSWRLLLRSVTSGLHFSNSRYISGDLIPKAWTSNLCRFLVSVAWMSSLAMRLDSATNTRIVSLELVSDSWSAPLTLLAWLTEPPAVGRFSETSLLREVFA